jgi:fused signal recognition particle receptor
VNLVGQLSPFVIVAILLLSVAGGLGVGWYFGRQRRLRSRPSRALEEGLEALQAPTTAPETAVQVARPEPGLIERLALGLTRTREALAQRLDAVFSRSLIDDAFYVSLEEALIQADVGAGASHRIVDDVRRDARASGLREPSLVRGLLRGIIVERLSRLDPGLRPWSADGPHVILVVGINGGGKTTTIGKLAARFTLEGRRVLLGAGDTYRAGAIEQLSIWADRAGVGIVTAAEGADPASVLYDTAHAAIARGYDTVIADTAGRLQNRRDLMDQLSKAMRALAKAIPGAPHEVLLVLDATIGQNALSQARIFGEVVGVTGLVLTKLDGTAKGGVVVAVCEDTGLPVKFIGVGEKIDDLRPFDAADFVDALLGETRVSPGFRGGEPTGG